MTTMSFSSRNPNDNGPSTEHGELGRRYEWILRQPGYTNPQDPQHMALVDEASAIAEAMYGDKPMESGQPFPVMSFQTGTPTVGDGKGTPDEHMHADHRPLD